jgi:WhiB family redox-sensing transcriptional regulator
MNWTERAACKDMPASLWFPEAGQSGATAKAVCAGCEVRAQCLQFALTTHEQYGIYGGLTPPERQRMNDGAILRQSRCARCEMPFTVWWE